MLVGARWVAGFLFRWSDLEILDDPMPETMYCRGVRRWKNSSSTSEIEGGGGGGGEEQVEERKIEDSKSTVNCYIHMYSLQSFIDICSTVHYNNFCVLL